MRQVCDLQIPDPTFRTLLRCLFVMTAALLFDPRMLHAQQEKNRISDIRVVGNQRTEAEQVLLVISSRVGEPIDRETIARDVRDLYALGVYEDIAVEAEPGTGGYVLTYRVKEHPSVAKLEVSGNDEIDDDELIKAIGMVENSIYTKARAKEAEDKILQMYADKGYFIATVSHSVVYDKDKNQVQVRFKIEENESVLVRRIDFSGNKVFSDNELRNAPNFYTKEKTLLSAWHLSDDGKYREDLFKQDIGALQYFYHNHGYLDVQVDAPVIRLSSDRKEIFITVPLEEGPQYTVGQVVIQGDLLWPAEEITAPLLTAPEKTFSRQDVISDAEQISNRYADEGYAFANVNPLPRPYEKDGQHIVDLVFQIEKGVQVTIDRILIVGNVKTRDNVIRRELKIRETDKFNRTKLEQSRREIEKLGFFDKITYVSERIPGVPDKVNIRFEVTERATGSLQVGAGFSSLDRFFAQGAVSQANLFGRGQRLSFQGQIGGSLKSVSISFEDPRIMDSYWGVGISARSLRQSDQDFDRRTDGGSLSVAYDLTEIRPWLENYEASVGLTVERIQLQSFSLSLLAAPPGTVNPNSLTTSTYLSMSRDTLNNRLDPTSGTLHRVSAEFATNLFKLSRDVNHFFRYRFSGDYYYPVEAGFLDIVLVGKWRLNLLDRREGTDLLLQERFFGGGINNLRGYSTRSIGPYLPGQDVGLFLAGGDKELYFSTEILFNLPVARQVGLRPVAFFDAGDVYNDDEKLFSSMLADVGFGIRWFSPLGPLRFEFGWPLVNNPHTGRTSVSGPAFQFAVGQAF